MYKVLIVDDESFVVSLIERLVEWEALGMKLVGSASGGVQALEMVEQLKPDILIADVMMPGIDGISLIKKVRKIDRDIKFIMISGHKRFEYAQSVMKYNVEDYLLKPIDKRELEGILSRIKQELDYRMIQRETKNKMNKQLDANKTLMNAMFMENLCSGKGDLFEKNTALASVNDLYLTEFKAAYYSCVIIQLNGITSDVGISFLEDLVLSISAEVEDIFKKACGSVLLFIDRSRIIFLLEYNEAERRVIDKYILQAFASANDMISKYSELKIAFGVGKEVHIQQNIAPLKGAMETARKAVDARFVLGCDKIIYYADINDDIIADTALVDEMLENFRNDIRNTSEAEIYKRIESIYDAASENAGISSTIYTDLAWEINRELYKYLRMFTDAEDLQARLHRKLWNKIQEAANKRDLVAALSDFVYSNIDEAVDDNKSNLSPAVRMAKKYIRNNYVQDIGLNDVSSVVNLSPVYFSRLFKKEANENFVDYLNRVRIDAAKMMLKDVKYNINEIAMECGFSDTRYFSKIFKRFVGITPSDYRKRQII